MPTLYRRKRVWYVNYTLNGRQLRKSTGTEDRKRAQIFLKKLELNLFTSQLTGKPIKSQTTLNNLFERYLIHVQSSSVPEYTRHVEWYLKTWLTYFTERGITRPESISTILANDFLSITIGSLSPKTKKEYLASLKACLNRAVAWDLLETNPISKMKPPARVIRKVRFLTNQEITNLLNNAPYDLKIAITILINTGIRLGELWALRWKDVDFPNKQIWIRSYDDFVPKGKKDRSVPLNTTALTTLEDLQQTRQDDDRFVYRLTCTHTRLSNKFGNYARKLGIKTRLHDLRHTFASHLVMAGTPLPVVRDLLGHSSITTTMIYTHLSPNIHKREVEKLRF